METQHNNISKKITLFGLILGAFVLGYLVYPQVNGRFFNGYGRSMMFNNNVSGTYYGRGMMNGSVSGGYPNFSMSQMMQYMTLGIQGRAGDDFDATFLEQMIPHHQGAINMARIVLTTSKRPELIKLANDIITSQQKEIDAMREWQKSWFGIKPL